jgi:uncharacterized membrane protein
MSVNERTKRLGKGLGWFSVGLGLTGLLAPKAIASISGVSKRRTGLIRLYGLGEFAAGIAIVYAMQPSNSHKRGIHAQGTCIVNSTPEEVYQFWRNFENLPRFMRHVNSVEELGDGRSHWKVKGPAGMEVEWDAKIVADVPNEVITWRTLENSDVDHAGAVRFERAAGGRGTIVKVNFEYQPIGGVIGATVAKLFGEEPEQQLDDDLRRFKQVLEVGEVIVSDATLLGTGYMEQRPGQPSEERTILR